MSKLFSKFRMRMAHIQDERWVHVINVHLIAPTARASNAVLSVAPFCMPRAVVYEVHNSRAGCAVLLCSIRLITQVITGIRVVKLLHWEPPYVARGSESAHCLGAPPSLICYMVAQTFCSVGMPVSCVTDETKPAVPL